MTNNQLDLKLIENRNNNSKLQAGLKQVEDALSGSSTAKRAKRARRQVKNSNNNLLVLSRSNSLGNLKKK